MPGKCKLKQSSLNSLTAHVAFREPTIFKRVQDFLAHAYRSSKSAQLVKLAPEVWRTTSEESDGKGGAALLTELFLRVLGNEVCRRRELCKRLLIAAAWSLRVPIYVMPSGAVSICMSPSGEAPVVARLVDKLVRALDLPAELLNLILAFAGDAWIGVRKSEPQRLFQSTATYALVASNVKTRRAVRRAVPFDACHMSFSNMPGVEGEWDGGKTLLWLSGASIWPLVIMLRHQQRLRMQASMTITIRGFGEVLV
jgi:hypothetical protein